MVAGTRDLAWRLEHLDAGGQAVVGKEKQS